jgi:uncharacterized protein YdeI (BOF family)
MTYKYPKLSSLLLKLLVLTFLISPLIGEDTPMNRTFHTIEQIKAQNWDKKFTWVQGTVIEKVGEDEFILQDSSGTITLFLPEERLYNLKLDKGHEISVWGMVDFGYSNKNKTELYAERIIVLPKKEPQVRTSSHNTSQNSIKIKQEVQSTSVQTFPVRVR